MAQFCVEIPDDKVVTVITSLCSLYRYQQIVSNPNYNPSLNDIPATIPNPLYVSEFIANPDFNPEDPESVMEIANPDYDPNQSEFIANPEYNAELIAANTTTITNPETAFQFANRMVRNWITENVKAYQAQVAAEQARQQALNDFSLEIADPQA